MSRWKIAKAALASVIAIPLLLLGCGGGAPLASPPPPGPSLMPSVTWSPSAVARVIFPGAQLRETIMFSSSSELQNTTVVVDASLQNYVTASPSTITSVPAQTTQSITLIISAPSNNPVGAVVNGDVKLRTSAGELSQHLTTTVEVEISSSKPPQDSDLVTDAKGSTYPVNQLVVDLTSDSSLATANSLAASVGGSVVGFMPSANAYQFELPSTTVTELESLQAALTTRPEVEGVFPNYLMAPFSTDLDNLAGRDPRLTKAYDLVRVREAWSILGDTGIKPASDQLVVGFIDSGIDAKHAEFANVNGAGPDDVPDKTCTPQGHGTSVIGIVGADNKSGSGSINEMNGFLSGIPSFQGKYKVMVRQPRIAIVFGLFVFEFGSSIDWLASQGATLINISYGAYKSEALPTALRTDPCSQGVSSTAFDTVNNLFLQGIKKYPDILFVIAAGDADIDAQNITPARIGSDSLVNNVLVVGGTRVSLTADGMDDRRAIFNSQLGKASSWGAAVGLAAPAMRVYAPIVTSVVPTAYGPYTDPITAGQFAGTSASAPMVTGAAGILKALKPTLTPAQIKSILVTSADDISPIDKPIGSCTLNADNTTYTCKRLNVLRAVQQVLGVTTCPPNGTILSLAIHPSNSIILYAGASIWGMFKSTDGAQNWTAIDSGYPLTGIIDGSAQALAIDPSNTQTVYAGTFNRGVFETTDGGQDWLPANAGLMNLDVRALAIDPKSSSTIYAGTVGGIFKSTNSGQNWASASSGVSNLFVTALAIDPTNSSVLYAGTFGGGIFRSTNGGTSWNQVNVGLSNLFVHALIIDSKASNILYASTNGGGVVKSSDGGQMWKATNVGLADPAVLSLAIDPNNSATLYAGTQSSGVFRSTDAGSNWVPVNAGKASYPEVLALTVDPTSFTTAYAGTLAGGVFRTTDGAQNWTPSSCGIAAPR